VANPFTQHHKILSFTMLFNQPDSPKVPLPVKASASNVTHVPWTPQTASRLVQPFLDSPQQGVRTLYNVH